MTYANTLRSALVSLALVAGVAQAGVAQAAEAVTSRPQALTRAEVVADFNLWHRVGLDQMLATPGYNFNSDEYQQAFAQYQALRSGPAYAEELARVRAAQRAR